MNNGFKKTFHVSATIMLLLASVNTLQAGGLVDTGPEAFGLTTFEDSQYITNPWWTLAPDDGYLNYLYFAEGPDECEWNLMEVMGSYTHDFDAPYLAVEARIILDRSWVDVECESDPTVEGFQAFMESEPEAAESTYDWYAQDVDENIWYLGEDTYNGEDKSGSFVAGCDGAEAGIVLPGDPDKGDFYQQEFYADEAEDWGKVLTFKLVDEEVCMKTKEWTPLEPGHLEHKFYCNDGVSGELAMVDELKGKTVVVELVGRDVDAPEQEITDQIHEEPACPE